MAPNTKDRGLLAETKDRSLNRRSDAPAELDQAEAEASEDDRSETDRYPHFSTQRGRNQATTVLADEIEIRLREALSSPEPSYTYSEDARRALAQIYTLLLSEGAEKKRQEKNSGEDQDAPLSAEEVQYD